MLLKQHRDHLLILKERWVTKLKNYKVRFDWHVIHAVRVAKELAGFKSPLQLIWLTPIHNLTMGDVEDIEEPDDGIFDHSETGSVTSTEDDHQLLLVDLVSGTAEIQLDGSDLEDTDGLATEEPVVSLKWDVEVCS